MLGRSVRIQLDGGNNQILHPGQTISGIVELKAPPGLIVRSVRIDFRGVTKILPKKNATHINIEHVELFQMGEVLQSGTIRLLDGKSYVWNFSFMLPTLTGPDRSGNVYQDGGNPCFEEGRHMLPPSIEPSDVRETKIEYNMYVIVTEAAPDIGIYRAMPTAGLRTMTDVLDHLKLLPDVEAVPDAMPSVLEKLATATDAPNRKFSLSSRRGSTIRNSQAALPIFVEAKVPPAIIAGKDIDILLSLRIADSDKAVSSGQCIHKSTSLSIESITHRRTAKTPHNAGLDITSTKKLHSPKAPRGFPIQPAPAMLLKFDTDAIRSWPPSFKSYSLAREYHLTLITVLEHDNQELEAKWTITVPLVHLASEEEVLSRRISNAPPPPAPIPDPPSEIDAWNRRRGVEDDLPPAYEPRENDA